MFFVLTYDAVIFDLDGTLTDSRPGIFACAEYALKKMGRPVPSESVMQRFLGPPLAESYMKYCGMSEEEAAYATELYREGCMPIGWKENKVYPRIRALLHELKARGAYLAVATGKPEHTSVEILRYFGLLQYFDAVAGPTPEDMHADKGTLISRVLPKDGRAVMVGDIDGDIQGALDQGIDSIAALYGYGEDSEVLAKHPTHAAKTTQDLCDILCPGMPGPKGFFVTLEGVDGCGKSTQAAALEELLAQFGYSVRRTREPGGCPLAEEIRKIVLAKEDNGMCAETEALLFAASRAQHLKDVIKPAVARGQIVLCDRFVDSSLVYQGIARELGLEWIGQINRFALRENAPDATLYLRMDSRTALTRRLAVSQPDRIEQAGNAFHSRTEEGFEALWRQHPERYLMINAAQAPEKVTEEAFRLLFARMLERGVL